MKVEKNEETLLNGLLTVQIFEEFAAGLSQNFFKKVGQVQRCHDGDMVSTKYWKEGVYYKYIGLDNCK